MAPSQSKEPLLLDTDPQYPFDKAVSDYFSLKGRRYLLYADRYSGWITVVKLNPLEGDFKHLRKHFTNLFATYGTPNEISDDGGPPFNSHAYSEFLKTWGIHGRKSSSYYAQSNGRAELAVETVKRILWDN